ncbi:histidine kinase/DNA gyrase B/HSP90-like ATPase [Thermomonospora umbrina]|uniref:Histidine kinase/DNA gyrase B/HSP90-like ATPase n=1 Tax=Thermomonospora umbrina TaxID=111806 RepID=A0A3D9SI55_9ACTN|nr:histidine kinase/DNA gyrase B/HSP90-like ATPase [Thermomonospora umbrina]
MAAAVVLAGLALRFQVPGAYRSPQPWRPEHVMGLVYPAVGAVVLRRRPRLVVAWLVWAIGLLAALQVVLQPLSRWAVAEGATGAAYLRWAAFWIYLLEFLPLITLLPLLYPGGRPPSRRWRPLLWLVCALIAVNVVFAALLPMRYTVGPLRVDNPVGVALVGELAAWRRPMEWLTVAAALGCLASLAVRFRSGGPVERRQIGWLGYVLVAVLLLGCLDMVVATPFALWIVPISLAVAGVPVAIAVAILRYRLYDIDLIVNRTLVYGALAAFTGALYFGLIGAVNLAVSGYGALAGLAGALVVGLTFQPLRLRLQRAVDRLFKVERDPYRLADRLSRTVQQARDPAAALTSALASTRQALGVGGAAVEIGDRDGGVRVHGDGDTADLPQEIPLRWHGATVGRLLLPPGRHDARLAGLLARHLADVAHAVRLTADLQASRERILSTREEERRRLRRDLHDGLGPTLAALALSLDAARLRLSTDPASVSESLASLRERMIATIGDIRELVYGLRPPALDNLGLEGALRALADDLPEPRVDVVVEDADVAGELPAAAEVAAYRIVQEALSNARRHADARQITVRLRRETHGLTLVVADDGVGLPMTADGRVPRAGVGLGSMRERAAELGGSCTIGPRPGGGTEVVARLPLSSARGAPAT